MLLAGQQSITGGCPASGSITTEQLPELGATGNGTIAYSQYDARGHVLRRFDGLNYLKYEFDKAEHLFKVKESNSGWTDVRTLRQFDYATANNGADKRNGRLLTATAYNVVSGSTIPIVETYTYAQVGGRISQRQTLVDHPGVGDDRTLNLDLTWTDLGKLASVAYPNDTQLGTAVEPDRTVSNTYSWGLLTAVPGYATSIGYHPNLMIDAVQHANNVTVTYAKDDNDMRRPKSITTAGAATNWLSGTYGFDGAGNIKSIGSDTFTYDLVSRLKEGTTSAGAKRQCAGYNAFGAVSALATSTSTCTPSPISVDHAINRLTESPSPLLDYDAAGDLLAWGGYVYTWDKLGRMLDVSGTGITKRTFLYTADGERIEERVGSDPLNPTSITLAARGLDNKVLRLLTKSGSSWAWTKDYVYRDGLHVASVEPPVAAQVVKHFHLDHLGTIRRITGTGTPAAVLASHDYYPFGGEATTAGQDTERMKFTGHERDLQGTPTVQTDDLDYMHARYYNMNIARFLSTDPITDVKRALKAPQMWNKYAYVANNPVNFTDPTGRLLKVGFSKEEDWTKLAKAVYAKTGLTLGLKNGVVSVLGDAYTAGARKNVSGVARSIILESINSKDTFSVSLVRADPKVTLGNSSVKLDMADLGSLRSSSVDTRAMDSSMTMFHELLHAVRGTTDPSTCCGTGQTVDIVNLIRDKLGLPERTMYHYTPVGPNTGELQFQGGVLAFTNY